ncbi:MAG: hypothetical protein H6Q10_2899 [Acidobacteria bacterium]|nr:hypothetical protein [Acidobacteriota bacterium]
MALAAAPLAPAAGSGAPQPAPGKAFTPVTWSAAVDPGSSVVRPGAVFTVVLTAKIDEGWHVYGAEETTNGPRPLRIGLAEGQPFTAGKLQAPAPKREHDAAFNQVTTSYAKPTTFRLPVTVSAGAVPGRHDVALEVRFQACDGRICLPGRTVKLSVPVEVGTGRTAP